MGRWRLTLRELGRGLSRQKSWGREGTFCGQQEWSLGRLQAAHDGVDGSTLSPLSIAARSTGSLLSTSRSSMFSRTSPRSSSALPTVLLVAMRSSHSLQIFRRWNSSRYFLFEPLFLFFGVNFWSWLSRLTMKWCQAGRQIYPPLDHTRIFRQLPNAMWSG